MLCTFGPHMVLFENIVLWQDILFVSTNYMRIRIHAELIVTEVNGLKSIEDLERVRKEALERLRIREGGAAKRIVVGMGTCGIAAGARDVVQAVLDELALRKISDVAITQTGCIGLCEYEPLVDVYTPGAPKVTYAHVTAEKARQIVSRHVINGQIIGEWTLVRT